MRFLVDAQLPRRLAHQLREMGHDAIHTRDLPRGNRTPDETINQMSIREQRVLVTKDADFVNSLLIQGRPYKLLLVSTGNISNPELEALFLANIEQIAEALKVYDFVEIDRATLLIHV